MNALWFWELPPQPLTLADIVRMTRTDWDRRFLFNENVKIGSQLRIRLPDGRPFTTPAKEAWLARLKACLLAAAA
jgi:hypothetical protein